MGLEIVTLFAVVVLGACGVAFGLVRHLDARNIKALEEKLQEQETRVESMDRVLADMLREQHKREDKKGSTMYD